MLNPNARMGNKQSNLVNKMKEHPNQVSSVPFDQTYKPRLKKQIQESNSKAISDACLQDENYVQLISEKTNMLKTVQELRTEREEDMYVHLFFLMVQLILNAKVTMFTKLSAHF